MLRASREAAQSRAPRYDSFTRIIAARFARWIRAPRADDRRLLLEAAQARCRLSRARTTTPVPLTRSVNAAASVATPERCRRNLRAVRSATERAHVPVDPRETAPPSAVRRGVGIGGADGERLERLTVRRNDARLRVHHGVSEARGVDEQARVASFLAASSASACFHEIIEPFFAFFHSLSRSYSHPDLLHPMMLVAFSK